MPKRVSIILFDDDTISQEGIVALLRVRPEFEILGTSVDLGAALRMVHQNAPDVVLLNLPARGKASLTLIASLRRESPRSRIIIMGMKPRHENVTGFVRAGASGFIMADASFDQLLDTIRSVARKATFLPRELTHSLFGQLIRARSGRVTKVPLVEIGPLDVGASMVPAA